MQRITRAVDIFKWFTYFLWFLKIQKYSILYFITQLLNAEWAFSSPFYISTSSLKSGTFLLTPRFIFTQRNIDLLKSFIPSREGEKLQEARYGHRHTGLASVNGHRKLLSEFVFVFSTRLFSPATVPVFISQASPTNLMRSPTEKQHQLRPSLGLPQCSENSLYNF